MAETDDLRGMPFTERWALRWALGCVNTASWLPLAVGREFMQPRAYIFADPFMHVYRDLQNKFSKETLTRQYKHEDRRRPSPPKFRPFASRASLDRHASPSILSALIDQEYLQREEDVQKRRQWQATSNYGLYCIQSPVFAHFESHDTLHNQSWEGL